jgi:hypothetical protein
MVSLNNRTRILSSITLAGMALCHTGCADGESLLLYRLPYANGTDVTITRDHESHTPADRLDMVGSGNQPMIVAAANGMVEFIEDSSSENCCGGNCANNYVWLSHAGNEWTKYSHIATDSATHDAGLSVGDSVVAGQFLGYESNVGRACGDHLHFEVAIPDDPNNPLVPGNGGFISGINRIPRFCSIPGQIAIDDEIYEAEHCTLLTTCMQSQESPSTEGQCEDGIGGEVCVQEINNVALTSTYTHGVDFEGTSLNLTLDWCGDSTCSNTTTGRAVLVVVSFQNANEDPIEFMANCQNPTINETVHDVQEIVVMEAPNLSDANTICGGNEVLDAFARWEFCETLLGN